MRLIKQVSVNGVLQQLVEDQVRAELNTPGRAILTLVANEAIQKGKLVTYEVGYSQQPALQRWFIGFVDSLVPIGDKRVKCFCRELSAALIHDISLQLRHVTLREVLTEVNKLTGLNFSTPDIAYANTKVSHFFHLGSGYQMMAMLGRVFNIPDYLWQQQGNGVIYVGSWADSRWAQMKNISLPQKLFDQQQATNSARVAIMPQLRPGMRINGNRLSEITLKANHMELVWNS